MSRTADPFNSSAKTAAVPGNPGGATIQPAAPEKVLILQSAHPRFVLQALERLRERPFFSNPQYELLCSDRSDILRYFQLHPMIAAIHAHSGARTVCKMLARLRREHYDCVVFFSTGEPGYWKTKWFAFLLGARRKLVFEENEQCFDFTWQTAYALFRRRWRIWPRNFRLYWINRSRPMLRRVGKSVWREVPAQGHVNYPGERILILQSADPEAVLRALDRLRQTRLFTDPRYTLFCRAFPEVKARFEQHTMLYEIREHASTRNSWSHLRSLRRERFDAVVFFLTGESGFWKIKCFAFLLGARHKVIFNENNDCFYFTWKVWLRLMAHRMAGQSGTPSQPHRVLQATGNALFLLKILLLPFRFAWLLLVWVRLRRSAMRAAG